MNSDSIKLKEYMDQSKNTVVVTGAGISYLYGMRRLKQSVGMLNARRVFSSGYVRKHPDKFYGVMKDAFLDATFVKGPSKVHRQLAKLEEMGKIQGIVTQNMDCLHTLAGSKYVAEFQGSFQDNVCVECGDRTGDMSVWNHGKMPRCEKCGGALMPISFCMDAPEHDKAAKESMDQAVDMIADAELVIVIGTTGFRSEEYMCRLKAGAKIVQINPSPTSFDGVAALNIHEDAAKVLDDILTEQEDGSL